jgi:hypothetical protein
VLYNKKWIWHENIKLLVFVFQFLVVLYGVYTHINIKCPIRMLQIMHSFLITAGSLAFPFMYILTYTDSVADIKCKFHFCLQHFSETLYAKVNIYSGDVHMK